MGYQWVDMGTLCQHNFKHNKGQMAFQKNADKNELDILVHMVEDHGGFGCNVAPVAQRLTGSG